VSLTWGPAEGLGPDIAAGVRRAKAMDGPHLIVWGSSTLTPVLLEHELADGGLAPRLSGSIRYRQTFLFGWNPATRIRAGQHKGCVLERYHQHLPA